MSEGVGMGCLYRNVILLVMINNMLGAGAYASKLLDVAAGKAPALGESPIT